VKIAKLFIALLIININAYAQEEDYAEVEWIRTYIGPDSVNSVSKGMALDKEGNIYVAVDDVATTDSGYSYDFIFVKYDNDGNEGWTERYSAIKSFNSVEDMVIDKESNIYIAGSADRRRKYVVLKYNHSGALQWENILNADDPPLSKPVKIAVDDSGNVYMASHTMDVYKYDINGKLIWNTPRGIPGGIGYVYSMVLDSEANIYLAGNDFILKYNSDGIKQWEASDTLAPRDILVNNNYVYVCGARGLTKYPKEGAEQWTSLYGENFYFSKHFTIDNSGDIILLGSYYNGFYEQHAIIKYNSDGIKLWEAFTQEPTFYLFSGIGDISHDKYGNIYIIRYNTKENVGSDISVIKFNPAGEKKWIMRYTGFPDATALEGPNLSIKVDSIGNVYVTGVTVFGNNREQSVTIKYRQPNFPVSVKQEDADTYAFQLFQNYPNPFNPNTILSYQLSEISYITLKVFDIIGSEVATLVDEQKEAGYYSISFDGSKLASGIYFVRLVAQSGERKLSMQTRKLVLIK
jgi:hypothetical protein